ncbi:hypothetical protein D3C77_766840 [compost metagenome]
MGAHVGGGVEGAAQVVDAQGIAIAVGDLLQFARRQLVTLAKQYAAHAGSSLLSCTKPRPVTQAGTAS